MIFPPKPRLIVVLGPTASGKTAHAIRLAKKVKGEIISFDAMQIYRGLPILTNQPSQKERKGIPHHLIGVLSLGKEFSAAQFSRMAKTAIHDVIRRRKIPILVGGSGFYLNALLSGTHAPARANPAIRKKYLRLRREKGNAFLYEKLRAMDPKRAKKIHPNDSYRILRALEIFEATGKRPSEFEKGRGGLSEDFTIEKIGLRLSREALYRKINERVHAMIGRGVLQEVRSVLGKKLSATAKKIIGLEEFSLSLKGKRPLEEAISEIQQSSRRYAKRQETWFRKEKEVRWLLRQGLKR